MHIWLIIRGMRLFLFEVHHLCHQIAPLDVLQQLPQELQVVAPDLLPLHQDAEELQAALHRLELSLFNFVAAEELHGGELRVRQGRGDGVQQAQERVHGAGRRPRGRDFGVRPPPFGGQSHSCQRRAISRERGETPEGGYDPDTIAIRSRYDPDPAPPRWPRPAPGTHVTPPLARPPRPPQDGGRAAAPEGRGFVLLSPPKLGLGSHCPDPSARRTGLGGAAECRACVGAELGAAGVLLRERPRCLSASAVARSRNSRMAESLGLERTSEIIESDL